ncbi:MAG: hypothetical protein IKZ08_02875 [Bacteroidales bacterium]|nr:hypothetical protein [Bacteroidales bacterium]
MARVLDLNTAARPTLELTMQDEDKTLFRVSTPTEGLLEELKSITPEMQAVIEKGDEQGVKEIYELAAKLISCNRDFKKVTGEELRGKYRMDLESAILFFNAYLDFINELTNAKN